MFDVIIPVHEKDRETLDVCIMQISKYLHDANRIITISTGKFTSCAEWLCESSFPFRHADIRDMIKNKGQTGWYFQQIIQFYLWDVIPDLNDNITVVNADVIFMRNVDFFVNGIPQYNTNTNMHGPYFEFIKALTGLDKFGNVSGCVHCVPYQKKYIQEIRQTAEKKHNMPFWKAFCASIYQGHVNGASEFELYYQWMRANHSDKMNDRRLKYADKGDFHNWKRYANDGYDYVAFHAYMRRR